MNKICIITCYFGKLPNYFVNWIQSVKYNKNIDFMIVTDCNIEYRLENLIVIQISLDQLRKRINNIFNLNVALYKPYKLCDLKVMYGVIFSNNLIPYEYWGHCDIDLIFGDLYYFLNKYEFYKYDKFLPLGHLSIYKNNTKINEAFMLDGAKHSYREVLLSPNNMFFDEWDGLLAIYEQNKELKMFGNRIFADISTAHKRLKLAKSENQINYKNQVFYWKNGKIFRSYEKSGQIFTDEYIYIHFQKRQFENCEVSDNTMVISHNIVASSENVDINFIKKYNKYNGFIYESFEYIISKLKYYIAKVKRKLEH